MMSQMFSNRSRIQVPRRVSFRRLHLSLSFSKTDEHNNSDRDDDDRAASIDDWLAGGLAGIDVASANVNTKREGKLFRNRSLQMKVHLPKLCEFIKIGTD